MNRKAIELAISTLIIIILGIVILIAIIVAITGGFDRFKDTTDTFLGTTQATAIKQSCSFACDNSDKITFCCTEHPLDDSTIKCTDSRLEISCAQITCEPDFCDS